MQYDHFIQLTKKSKPSDKLLEVHLAIWYVVKDNWEMAHNIVQDINSKYAFWIHAYLHRVEGDLDNAHYWYNRASKKPSSESLKSELDDIIQLLFL